ncbi:hypothetical protein [[Mycoplasma] anseris]|uniref:Glucose-6-phosphate isomerase n=1 Tax=[Mycoplasma] anseris TaxID=92400 RepID=A0A2Z4NCQ1_9BACT|nr:hypothetical protein [[Mycoplasma] anseris]AWX69332.1 hypothetical protein DP065_00995 [[Mycoplasma] anseris]
MANNCKITISNQFAIKDEAINKFQAFINDINHRINKKTMSGHENYGFRDPLKNTIEQDLIKIQKEAKLLKDEGVQVLLVIGGKHICLQSQAFIDLFMPKLNKNKGLEIIYVDEYLDGRDLTNLINYLEDKTFAINVISQNSESLETLILYREFRSLLEQVFSKAVANKYIYITTNNNFGYLFEEVTNNNLKHFILLDNLTERYLGLSPAVLFPLACADINIKEVIDGAIKAKAWFSIDDLEKNSAYRYAVIKYILYRNEFKIENINVFSKQEMKLGELFQMYASESCVKQKKGILPILNHANSSIKAFGQSLAENEFKIFYTTIHIQIPKYDFKIAPYQNQSDEHIKYLIDTTYNKINRTVIESFIENHVIIYKIPNIKIEIMDDNVETFGWILSFLHYSSIMFAYLIGVNPFINNTQNSFNINFKKNIKDI